MRRVSRPSCDDGPLLEEQETEGQRQLHSLLLQQLHTDVDIDSCVAKRRCFAPAALYRPFGEQAAGVRSLSQFQALQDGERELVRLRELGLTDAEIQLWQSRDLKEAAEQRCGVSAAPAAKQQRLQVIRDKMEARAQLLSRPQRFAASRPLSRREMEIERALFQGSDRLGFLSALYHRDAESQGEQQGASASDPMDSIYREVLSQDAPAGHPPASAADTSQTAATNLSQHSQRDGAQSQRLDGQSQSSQRDDGPSQGPQRHDGQSQSSQRHDGQSQSSQRNDGQSLSSQRNDGQSQSSQRHDSQLLSSQTDDGQWQSSQRDDSQSRRHDGQSQSSQRDGGQSEATDVGSDLRGERMSSSESNVKRANACGQVKLHLTQPIGSLRGEPEAGSGPPLTVRGQIQAPSDEEILRNRESEEGIRSIPRFRSYEPGSPSQVLCVKNLSAQASVAQLVALFSRFQERDGPPVLYRLLTGRMRGQAFITLPDADVAQKALQLVHGYRLLGKPLVVEFGRRRKEEEKHKEEEVQEHKE